MKGSRRIPAVHIAGILALLAIVSLAVLVVRGADSDGSDKDQNKGKAAQTVSPWPTGDPTAEATHSQHPLSPVKIESLGRTAERFISAQYDRDPDLTVGRLRDRLSPLVTDSYLLRYPPTLATESDEWVKRERGTIVASSVVEAPDRLIGETEAFVYVEVTLKGESDGSTMPPYSFTVRLRMVWGRGWKVDDVV